MSLPAGDLSTSGLRSRTSPFSAQLTLVIARVGDRRFALSAEAVERVLRMAAFTVTPGIPPGVVGLLNLHGAVLPVIDARPLFQQAAVQPSADQHLLILGDGERRALWVDAVEYVAHITSSLVHQLPSSAPGDPVAAVVHLESDILPLLSSSAILPGGWSRHGEAGRS